MTALASKPQFFAVTGVYPLSDLKQVMLDVMAEGVARPFDLAVSQRAAGGANMSVDLHGADAGGPAVAYIIGDTTPGVEGIYRQRVSESTPNLVIGANGAGVPRVDLVVIRVDPITQIGHYEIVQGTAGSGAPAAPSTTVVLAEVTVAAGATSITNANIVDRRVMAKHPVYSTALTNPVTVTLSWTDILSLTVNLARDRYVELEAQLKTTNTGGATATFDLALLDNGVLIPDGRMGTTQVIVNEEATFSHRVEVPVAAGTHVFKLQAIRSAGLFDAAGSGVNTGYTSKLTKLWAKVY